MSGQAARLLQRCRCRSSESAPSAASDNRYAEFLMAEDRLDQKLTLTCNDGRSIDGDLNLGGLPDWPALTTFVISFTLILFLAQWSFRFEEVDPAVEYKGQSEAFWR